MTKEQIEDLIKKNIAEAKFEISEARLRHLIWTGTALFALFGVVIPFWLSGVSTAKVDKSIEEMNSKFEKLASSQLQQADIKCLVKGKPIENSTVVLDLQNQYIILEFQNLGRGTAYNTETFLFLDYKDTVTVTSWGYGWYQHEISDDDKYSRQFEFANSLEHFSPTRTWVLKLKVDFFKRNPLNVPAKLVIYSFTSGPWEYRFAISQK